MTFTADLYALGAVMFKALAGAHVFGDLTEGKLAMAKLNNVNAALEICRKARTILGANGILDEYPVMRHMANLESVKTYEGTHEMHTLIVGEDITGIPAYE